MCHRYFFNKNSEILSENGVSHIISYIIPPAVAFEMGFEDSS